MKFYIRGDDMKLEDFKMTKKKKRDLLRRIIILSIALGQVAMVIASIIIGMMIYDGIPYGL
jgi:hypothetical protein